jgi:S-formylglutathione hydrolase FrmB
MVKLRIPLFAFLLLLFLSSQIAFGQERIECNAFRSQILKSAVRYCVLLPAVYDSALRGHLSKPYPVIYFLHGLGENEQSLFNSGGWNAIGDLRRQKKIGDIVIVAPDGRQSFYINSADGKLRYSDFFLREFMPYIEGKYLVSHEKAGRAITGLSMGGYGALRFAFAYPQLFSSVSAQSAALMTLSPQELNGTIRTSTPLGALLAAVFGEPIDIPHWRQNDPFLLARKNQAMLRDLAIYFNCGDEDEYGFEKGARALDRQLQAEHVAHEFHLYPGNHGFAYFMDHLPETIQFHWNAFQAAASKQRSVHARH